jgi:hypothetical protein
MAKDSYAMVGSWAFVILLVIAIIAGFMGMTGDNIVLALVVLGLIVGLLNISAKEVGLFLIAAIAFIVSATSLSSLPVGGGMITAIFGNIATAISPAAAVVALKAIYVLAKAK